VGGRECVWGDVGCFVFVGMVAVVGSRIVPDESVGRSISDFGCRYACAIIVLFGG